MLELQGLRKRFGEIEALDDVSFTVRPGRITGFLGRNGAGKSTTMRSIFGLVNLDDGVIRWRAEPVDEGVMTRFGFMPEQRGLYRKMRVREQVSWFAQLKGLDRSTADTAASDLLEQLGLGDRLDDKLEALSHGNQQRVQLATALAHDPDLCVLDEPFNGLDPSAVRLLSERLRALANDGRAVLFSSHQLDLIEGLCDEVVIIDRGTIRATGTVVEVRRGPGHQVLTMSFDRSPDWSSLNQAGVTATGTRSGGVTLTGPDRLHELLDVARCSGTLTAFSFDLPSLSDVFEGLTR